jgi:NAD(P)-dependent dehydrogenase (short-subunit alcohol dehydrogenase family)
MASAFCQCIGTTARILAEPAHVHDEATGCSNRSRPREDAMNWNETSVLLTGATRGLGLALAQDLGRRGAKIAVVAQNAVRLSEALAELTRADVRAFGIRADVGEKEAIHRVVGHAQALIGPIDVLVHNASTLGPTPLPSLLDTECEDFMRVLEVNLVGPFRLSKALAPSMLVRGRGLIAHISSDAAVEAYPNWGAYGVSKAALDHLSRSFAAELADTPVRVLSIDPGEMDTDMHRAALPEADPDTLASPALVAARISRIFEDADGFPSGTRVRARDVEDSSKERS